MTAPRFDPASYPGPRAAGPVLVHRGEVAPLHVDASLPAPFSLAPGGRGSVPSVAGDAPVLEVQDEIRWSVAYGSNASPERLIDKGLDAAGAILLPARMVDWVPAFEARRTGYGAVPLTLVPQAGAVVATWLLGLPADHLDELDRTEGRVATAVPGPGLVSEDTVRYAPPGSYRLGRVGDVAAADRFVVRGALAYLPGATTLVQHTGTAWRSWPEHDQAAAVVGLGDGGGTTAAPTAEPVLGPWPRTQLEDLPLFVYGSLQPDQPAWHRIADLVEVVGTASTPGCIWDTGNGWPAATFVPPGPTGTSGDAEAPGDAEATRDAEAAGDGEIQGTVVSPTDAPAAAELFRRADAYEGVPELFRRVAVRVAMDDNSRWAATYTWAGAEPPGTRLDGGRWPVGG